MGSPSPAEALRFLERGDVPGVEAASEDERVAFARSCLPLREFKEKAWPHFACFVDASNVARRRYANPPKASLADLDAVVTLLRRARYAPIVVSDTNLFQIIDEPYEYQAKYTKYPHSVADRRQADAVVLHALRRLPEAAVVTNDRFSKPDEARDFGDVLRARDRFYRHAWEGETPSLHAPDGSPMPGALRRLARRFSAPAAAP